MKPIFILFLLLLNTPAKGQQDSLPEELFPWKETENYWQDLYRNPEFRNFYKGENPEEMIRKAMEYARENDVTPENQQDFLSDLADDISGELLESFGEEVLEQLMAETGIARYLDQVYEKLLKATLPRPGGIPVLDPGMSPAINKGNTPHNLKTMLKLAVEKWLNEQWEKQVKDIYRIQREDLEYRKAAGPAALLKMAGMDYEHFLSLEIMLPEKALSYAAQVQQIYQSGDESFPKGRALFSEFSITSTGFEVPQQPVALHLLEENRKVAMTTSWEMINQRRKSLAMAYLQLAERAPQKGQDLEEALKRENHFKMTDGDRLKAQRIVQAFMEDSFFYREKADLLLKESLKNAGTEKKAAHVAQYEQTLRLKNLAQ